MKQFQRRLEALEAITSPQGQQVDAATIDALVEESLTAWKNIVLVEHPHATPEELARVFLPPATTATDRLIIKTFVALAQEWRI